MPVRSFIWLLLLPFIPFQLLLSQNTVTYAGSSGKETFHDVIQLSDGTFVVSGSATDLAWLPASVTPTMLGNADNLHNALGTNQYAFLLHLSSNGQTILHAVHLPQGKAENIRYLKTTNVPGQTTGDLYISGRTEDSNANDGGYFIAKLNNNFLNGVPTSLVGRVNIWAEGNPKEYQPWDVTNDGRVLYISGQSHAYDWAAAYMLDANGNRMVVNNWRTHWADNGAGGTTEIKQTPASSITGYNVLYSGIVFKRWGRCDLRSWTATDFNATLPDGNGGTKKGRWPLDFLYNSPCDPAAPTHVGPGYTGYGMSTTPVNGPSNVVIDRRNNDLYIGMNVKSVLPDGLPDFEPAVIAMDADGELKWWSRLYHEITPSGDTVNSSPDQYVDALAIDYSPPASDGDLVVLARAHGNNVENLWEGNTIAINPSASGFQNQFTGSSGNIHLSWLGKLKITDGTLQHSTYIGEYAEGASGLGTPHPDTNLDGWENPNTGWPTLNSTRATKNMLRVTADGAVCVLATGRRTITTANAYQQMLHPGEGQSAWNSFVRVYAPDLSVPLYSSLIVGQWNGTDGSGGDNTNLYGIWKTADGIVVVGDHKESSSTPGTAAGQPIPTANVPTWGSATPNGHSAIFGMLTATNLVNPADGNCTFSPLVSGIATVCAANTLTYSVPPIAGSTYQWTVTNGTIVSGQNTATISVQWGAGSVGTVTVVQTTP